MQRRIMSVLMGMLLSVCVTTLALATEYVYVTKNGKKYHNAESRFIQGKESVEKITLEEAQERGLEPSSSYLKSKENDLQETSTKKSSKKEIQDDQK